MGQDIDITRKIIALLALRTATGVSQALIDSLSSARSETELFKKLDLTAELQYLKESYLNSEVRLFAAGDIKRWEGSGISLLAVGSPDYPELLAKIYNPPALLFCRGEIPAKRFPLAIVGSRAADPQGARFASTLAAELASSGACIISGLALGIDGMAHRGALSGSQQGATVAVLGSGLNEVYPRRHLKLAGEILASGGALISQFEPDTPPYPSNFLDRNRVIAGLSRAVIVVQAKKRSGALVTARYALEEGRDVLAVPGSPGNPLSAGTNKLIKSGAYLVSSAEDVCELFEQLSSNKETAGRAGCSDPVCRLLAESGEMHIDELSRRLGLQDNLHLKLLELELAGSIERRPGNLVALKTY
ncbi:MAG: DNA-protecting protein DprA [Candidatus Dadabacteria bacterium]|nr:MAG: DNA-protecting protein DprA [Candidatus Dadabacteria bacterium]